MTYEQALSFIDRIKDTAIGAPVKGRFIQSLFIGPTDWGQMCNFMNLRVKVGDEAALLELSSQGMSLSVYGSADISGAFHLLNRSLNSFFAS